MPSGAEFIVSVIPEVAVKDMANSFKLLNDQAIKLTVSITQSGTKALEEGVKKTETRMGKFYEKTKEQIKDVFKEAIGTAIGNTISSALDKALEATETTVSRMRNSIDTNLSRDEKITRAAKRYGVGPARLNTLMRLGQSYGVDENQILSSFGDFKEKVDRGLINTGGKDVLNSFLGAIEQVSRSGNYGQNIAVQNDVASQLLGGTSLEGLYSRTPSEIAKRLKALGSGTESVKTKNSLMRNASDTYDNVLLSKTKLAGKQQRTVEDMAGKDNKTTEEIVTDELQRQTEFLEASAEDMKELLKAVQTMDEIKDGITHLETTVTSWFTKLVNKVEHNAFTGSTAKQRALNQPFIDDAYERMQAK